MEVPSPAANPTPGLEVLGNRLDSGGRHRLGRVSPCTVWRRRRPEIPSAASRPARFPKGWLTAVRSVATLRTIIQTARKQGWNVLETLAHPEPTQLIPQLRH